LSSNGGSNPDLHATRYHALRLAGYSFLILFFELALIRYVPGYVRIVGFYVNFILIATFLGMSVGLLRTDDADRLRWIGPLVLLILLVLVKYFSDLRVQPPDDPNHYLYPGDSGISENVRQIGILPVALLIFVLSSAVFVPLGALLGREFRHFKPLHAYSIDIGGSLLGILAFAYLSWTRTTPVAWFAVGFVVWIVLSLERRRFAVALIPIAGLVLGLVKWTSGPGVEFWSPYYRVSVFRSTDRHVIAVNGAFHQYVANLDPAGHVADERMKAMRHDYLRPYGLVKRPDTALVVGAGTGNDVAILLQVGVQHIDAVEIDPVILDLGRVLHFQEPYSDPRVNAITDDARAFLRNTDRTYDVIVFGTLDSHTQLAGMGSLRLDNYVYTREAFRAAVAHLVPGGTLIAYHFSLDPFIAAKIRQLIEDAYGRSPVMIYDSIPSFFNMTFVAGETNGAAASLPPVPGGIYEPVETPEDNWPYLYLRHRTVPGHYRHTLFGILAIAFVAITAAAWKPLMRDEGLDGAMFFMGMGFLLVETKSVTEMSLLFGSTWVVNVLVFSSILVVILLGNLLVIKRPPRGTGRLFVGLFAALIAAYLVPVRDLLWLGTVGKWLASGVMVALPIFFAALIFATLFRLRANSSRALAFNIMGAVVGGVLEYSSMVFGIKALYLVAVLAYLGAWLFTRRRMLLRPAGAVVQ
jgi:spermidine synthase